MSTTRFLSNDSLWSELPVRVKAAKRVRAAVAFLGSGGADILPFKKGDSLVVNLGMQTVSQGLTSPIEIQRLIRRGVHVFTRSTLHAKFFICDQVLIVGSANVSTNSQRVLDEAASITTDFSAIRRAEAFFDKLCTEPVRSEYLNLCLKAYRPPIFNGKSTPRSGMHTRRVVEAKLWFIGGLVQSELPEEESGNAERIQKRSEKKLKKASGSYVDFTHYAKRPSYFSDIQTGDWILLCIANAEKERLVYAPRQVLGTESYARGSGKMRHLLLSEALDNSQEMALAKFRTRVRRLVPKLDADRPRTMPIESIESADTILGFWTPSGRIAKPATRRTYANDK